MQIKVNIDGYGTFEIENDKIPELIGWLSRNQAVSIKPKNQVVKEVIYNSFTGKELLEEQNK